jgi:hypothetical protein
MPVVRSVTLAVLAFALAACDRAPTEPTELLSPVPIQFDFLNGPDDLPNLFRYEGHVGFAIRDNEAQLLVRAGLPANIADLTVCGGTVPFQPVSIQTSGELQGVLHELRMGSDLRLTVFDLTNFSGICQSTPIGTGEGRAMYTDNDLNLSLTRGNSFGLRILGVVYDPGGQRYQLSAESRSVILPDGTFKPVLQRVHLVPVGAP